MGSSELGVGVLFHRVPGRDPAGWLYHYFITKKKKSAIEQRRERGGKPYMPGKQTLAQTF